MTTFYLAPFIAGEREWGLQTFGPGRRTADIVAHIKRELDEEIVANPDDAYEWIDVIMLGIAGAWRAGLSPAEICEGLVAKAAINRSRSWPAWQPEDVVTEHLR